MNLLAIHDLVVSEFNMFWGSNTSVAWPNLDFDATEQLEWVRISIIPANSTQKSMGGSTNTHRQSGLVMIEIYVDLNSGARRSVELADLAINFFHNMATDGLTLLSPDTVLLGDSEGWYQKNVLCNFYSDNDF